MAVGPSSASSGSPSKGGCPSHPSLPRYLSCWHRGLRHASCLQGYRSREQLIGFLITRASRGHVMLSKNPLLLTLCSDGSTRGPARSAVPNKPLAGEKRAVFHADAPDLLSQLSWSILWLGCWRREVPLSSHSPDTGKGLKHA